MTWHASVPVVVFVLTISLKVIDWTLGLPPLPAYRLPSAVNQWRGIKYHQYPIIMHVTKQYRSVQASSYISCQNSIVVGF